jgi:hypothetical protein
MPEFSRFPPSFPSDVLDRFPYAFLALPTFSHPIVCHIYTASSKVSSTHAADISPLKDKSNLQLEMYFPFISFTLYHGSKTFEYKPKRYFVTPKCTQ